MNNNYTLGQSGESLAEEHYLKQGYKLVVKNFQFYKNGTQGRQGEIDLIMVSRQKLVLIEVKSRSDLQFGHPAEQINKAKLRHLYKTYQYFLLKNKEYKNYFCRFDVVSILGTNIEVITNAYSFESILWK